jgi:hypothetical protein
MTHDELLAKLISHAGLAHMNPDEYARKYSMDSRSPWYNALRAVVERHKPWVNFEGKTVCAECCNYGAETYPCVTIKDIEEELS